MTGADQKRDLATQLDPLRDMGFIRGVELTLAPKVADRRPDARVKLKTPRRVFTLVVETKRTFLDQAITNAVIAEHLEVVKRNRLPLLLLARYIPRPTGERLAAAGVNFLDRVGNMHLKLGDEYHILILGRREARPDPTRRRPGPALIQLFFALLADPAALTWPIRKLAEAAGIGKTAAAEGRQRLVHLGVLRPAGKERYRLTGDRRLIDDFLAGYNQVLRPHLLVGRFRAPERDPQAFVRGLADTAAQANTKWAVTGGVAAYEIDRFYRGEGVTLFVDPFTPALQRELRLVPDRHGPVTILRGFGQKWKWRTVNHVDVAHPWLIYAELLHDGHPRALETAAQIRETHLKA
ncbi:MAG: hypothetical protein HYS05_09815 [Acidobacteria bacterium]|nr:hypothetical protein [Acidobacteriota bacterium]